MKYKVTDKSGIIYNMVFNKYVEKENIKDSYIVWYISLDGKYESMVFEHRHYIYYHNLEESLIDDDFRLVGSGDE